METTNEYVMMDSYKVLSVINVFSSIIFEIVSVSVDDNLGHILRIAEIEELELIKDHYKINMSYNSTFENDKKLSTIAISFKVPAVGRGGLLLTTQINLRLYQIYDFKEDNEENYIEIEIFDITDNNSKLITKTRINETDCRFKILHRLVHIIYTEIDDNVFEI